MTIVSHPESSLNDYNDKQPRSSLLRFTSSQINRTLLHPSLPQPGQPDNQQATLNPNRNKNNDHHTFVLTADTQFGMTRRNRDWALEMEYSTQAIEAINALSPRPLYCCVCGDLVDMTAQLFQGSLKTNDHGKRDDGKKQSANKGARPRWTNEECDEIQDAQNRDFMMIWSKLHPDIALVCVCGNHDVGNRPNAATIQRFTNTFGSDYLAFWANGTYNIVLNTNLFSDPTDAPDLYQQQLTWLQERLEYSSTNHATHIFLYGHHPWLLHRDDEDETKDLPGVSRLPEEWLDDDDPSSKQTIHDGYFVIPRKYRQQVLHLCQEYKVAAIFSGHFHQNWIAYTSFGMPMIVTSSLSVLLRSSSVPHDFGEPAARGYRVVTVQDGQDEQGRGRFQHKFYTL